MRIIKELQIKDVNITIFKMEQKFTLKLEWQRMEQVFKLDGREGIEDVNNVIDVIDKEFIENVQSVFQSMLKNRNERLKALQEVEDEEFPEII
ncbi:MAG: hypothetical protein V3V00_14175 [Saprospiraceae bacterium]